MRPFLPIALSCLITVTLRANGPATDVPVRFDKLVHDYGRIKSPSESKHTCTFSFTNVSADDVLVSTVKSTCRCYSAEWTRKAVPPGGKGYISVSLDNNGIDGVFVKTVLVYFAGTDKPVTLKLTGESYIPSMLEQRHQYRFGALGIGNPVIDAGVVKEGDPVSLTLLLANVSSEAVDVEFRDISDGLQLSPVAFSIPAESEYAVSATIKTADAVGPRSFYCIPLVNGREHTADRPFKKDDSSPARYLISDPDRLAGTGKKAVCFRALVIPDVRESTNNPEIETVSDCIGFGRISKGKTAEVTFIIRNTGTGNLKILDKQHVNALLVEYPETIRPGRTGKIKCRLDTNACPTGDVTAVVTLITNSQTSPLVSLSMTGCIVKA